LEPALFPIDLRELLQKHHSAKFDFTRRRKGDATQPDDTTLVSLKYDSSNTCATTKTKKKAPMLFCFLIFKMKDNDSEDSEMEADLRMIAPSKKRVVLEDPEVQPVSGLHSASASTPNVDFECLFDFNSRNLFFDSEVNEKVS
jgi:hypothetical protein